MSSRFHRSLLLCALLAAALAPTAAAQQVAFTSSNLPIVLLDTDGKEIPDEPKLTARMQIIDNGPGVRNAVTDTPTGYDGFIGIEKRGSSSQNFPKKQYGIETRDAAGEDLDVSILGFPEESDWVLYAPYSDKSLMRNVLAYGMARQMGHYASRTRFCEVVLNGQYQGVYVFMEKIKRDAERVDINKLKPDETSGDDLTGGYIIKIDKTTGSDGGGWTSAFQPGYSTSARVYYQYEEPKADEIAAEQQAYIREYVRAFEQTMTESTFEDPATGYPAYIDLASFVDYFLVNEVGRNVDGYRLSAFLYKDKDSNGGLLHAGPVWDFNLAYGNADYYDGSNTAGFQVDFNQRNDPFPMPFWWPKLSQSSGFQAMLAERWSALRKGFLHTDSVLATIDANAALLGEAQVRNFQRWPVLGTYVWPNMYIGYTYASEVRYLKTWLRNRLTWLDATFPQPVAVTPAEYARAGFTLSPPRPHPARDRAALTLRVARPQPVTAEVFDVQGRCVAVLHDGVVAADTDLALSVDATTLPPGVYFVRVQGADFTATRPVVVAGR